jgi:putative ABC transport system permease protein
MPPERTRGTWYPPSLESFAQDARYTVRTLARSPGFTLVAVLILALGIGANTAIFSLLNAMLLKPLPFHEPDRLVVLCLDLSDRGIPGCVNPAPGDFFDWQERSRSFTDMAMLAGGLRYPLTGAGEPTRLMGTQTTANLFSLLEMQPLLGRTFVPDDEGPDASPVVVISEGLWIRHFGADPGLIGRSIVVAGQSHTVIGVVPSDFKFPMDTDVWVTSAVTPERRAQRSNHTMDVVARLAPGATLQQAQAEMTAVASVLASEYPVSNSGKRVTVAPLQGHLARDARPTLFILLAAVGTVLLITCANLANLMLARGAGRRRELALRKSLGAADGRMLRQLLTESTVLAGLGVIAGVALSTLSFDYLARLIPGTYPEGAAPGLDWRVLAFSAGAAFSTALLFGAGPALAAARLEPNQALKHGVGAAVPRPGRIRNALVIAEITLTVVLLAAAGLLLRSYVHVITADPGFRPDNLLVAETILSPAQYGDPVARSAFYTRVIERVIALPGVTGAAYVSYPPLVLKGGRFVITIDGQPAPPPDETARYITSGRSVSAGYLATLGVPLIRGRHFDERDVAGAPLAVVINQAMARLHWPDQDPLGARFRIGGGPQSNTPWYTVVGVVGDVRQMGLDLPAEPEMYFSFDQAPANVPFFWPENLLVRTQGDPMAVADAVRNAVWEADANQPVARIRSMGEIFDTELANRNTQLTLVGGFAVLALLLAAVGLYGVLSYNVAQRTSEIGLRVALGAEHGRVVRGVLRSAVLLALAGIAIGLVFAFGLTRWLASFLYGVSPTDPMTFAGVLTLLLLVTLLASYVPARRAARIDPMAALRND